MARERVPRPTTARYSLRGGTSSGPDPSPAFSELHHSSHSTGYLQFFTTAFSEYPGSIPNRACQSSKMPPARRKTPSASTANGRSTQAQQKTLSFGPQNTGNRVTKPSANASATASTKSSKKPTLETISSHQPPEVTAVENTPSPIDTTIVIPEDPANDPVPEIASKTKTASSRTSSANKTTSSAVARPLALRKQASGPPPPSTQPPPSSITKTATTTKSRPAKTAQVPETKEALATKVTDAQIKKYWRAKEDSRIVPRVHQSDLNIHEKILREFDSSSQFGVSTNTPPFAPPSIPSPPSSHRSQHTSSSFSSFSLLSPRSSSLNYLRKHNPFVAFPACPQLMC